VEELKKPNLRLDYNMVRAKKQPLQVGDKRLILLAVLTNAVVGDSYYQYVDPDGRILLVPERLEEGIDDCDD